MPTPLSFLSPIHKATREIAIYLEPRMAALDLSNSESHVVSYVSVYGPCSIGDLHRVFGTKRSTLTGILDRLEVRGALTRTLDPEDRRSFRVEATRVGRRLADRVREVVDELEARIREEITDEDLNGFRNVLTAMGAVTDISLRPREEV